MNNLNTNQKQYLNKILTSIIRNCESSQIAEYYEHNKYCYEIKILNTTGTYYLHYANNTFIQIDNIRQYDNYLTIQIDIVNKRKFNNL
jgi:hypothetical protein